MEIKKNLNRRQYWGESTNKKRLWKHHGDTHYRGEIKIAGNLGDLKECATCKKTLPAMAYATKGLRADGAYYLNGMCRECKSIINRESNYVKKHAPPKPFFCECCFKTTNHLQVDHIHGTFIFRGWACKDCNTGLGLFKDNLKGLLVGALYLEKDPKKIIEELTNLVKERETDEGDKE